MQLCQAEKFCRAYNSGDMMIASSMLGNWLSDVDEDASEDFKVLYFEDGSCCGYRRSAEGRKGEGWLIADRGAVKPS